MQMQTPKSSSKASSEGSRKISPRSGSSDTSQWRPARKLKTTGLEPNSSSVNQPTIRTPKSTNSVINDRRSPRSPNSEQKKRPGRISELETEITQLQDALKTIKDQLISSESLKDQAQQDAEESRKEVVAMSLRLEESQKLLAQSSSHEQHIYTADLDSVAAAITEINQLKIKLDEKSESEAPKTEPSESAISDIHTLKETMAKTLSLVETMKTELKDCKISESRAQELAKETFLELETAKNTINSLRFDQSRELESENLDETRFNEEESRKIMEITRVKLSEQMEELKKSKEEIEELKANLMDKETELQGICEENDDLNLKLKNSQSGKRENELENEIKNLKQEFDFLKSRMIVMETELEHKSDENEKLKNEIKKMDCKYSLGFSESDNLAEEIEKSNRRLARVAEELEAAQALNCEMEADLRKMKVQSDQWRKAAEAAAAMVSAGNNTDRKLMERTGSMDNCSLGGDDDDDEFLKKKNGNVLKRIGVLWKKPQTKRQQ